MPNFTKEAIKASFIKLLNEQPLSRISVRSIVEDCGINRNSFYYHFQDIPSLIEAIIAEKAENLIQEYPTIRSLDECFQVASRFVLENKRAILHIYNSVNRDIFEQYLMKMCEYVVTTYLDTIIGETPLGEQDRRILIRVVKCECFGVCIEWMDNGLNEDALDDLQRFLAVGRGLPEELLEHIRQNQTEKR